MKLLDVYFSPASLYYSPLNRNILLTTLTSKQPQYLFFHRVRGQVSDQYKTTDKTVFLGAF
jgi:hypothetical protein